MIKDILNGHVPGVSIYPEGMGTHIQIVLDIVTGDNYEEITHSLQNAGFIIVQDDGQVQSWFHPKKTPDQF